MKRKTNPDELNLDYFSGPKLSRLEQHLQSRLREFDALAPEEQEIARSIAEAERTFLKTIQDVFSKGGRDDEFREYPGKSSGSLRLFEPQ